jgi:predicted ATPase
LQLRNNIQEQPEEVIELIGREAEQELWVHRLNAARSGQGSLTLLSGEPGIGKTHLAKKLAHMAKEAGFVPLFTTCYPEQTELPFSPIVELLEQALASLEPEELPLCLEYCSPELYRMLPCLSHLASFNESNAEPNLQSVFVSVAQLLVWLQRQHPLLLVIDDLHYMPGPSARLLRYLLSHLNLRSLLVLGTLRPLSSELMPPEINRFLDWTGENPDNFKKLQRLEAGELHRLITLRSGHAPWNSVLELVGRASRGNPRLALELLTEWRSEAVLGLDNGLWSVNTPWTNQIPQRVSAYIKRVVGSLHADAQVLLALASLIGQSFSFEILRRIITQRNDGAGWWIELDKTRLGQALEELTSCELVQENGVEYFFAYPLLAETLTANLPNGQRRCWQEVILWAQQQA